MDYKVQVKAGQPIDVCVRNRQGNLTVTILGSTDFKHKILDEDTVGVPWAVLFQNITPKTDIIWISVEGTLATVNGLAGKRIDPESEILMRIENYLK